MSMLDDITQDSIDEVLRPSIYLLVGIGARVVAPGAGGGSRNGKSDVWTASSNLELSRADVLDCRLAVWCSGGNTGKRVVHAAGLGP